jgi:hypothetical protein
MQKLSKNVSRRDGFCDGLGEGVVKLSGWVLTEWDARTCWKKQTGSVL